MSNALQVDEFAAGVVDNSGVPLAGGKVYTYAAGTTADKATYTDSSMTTAETNPIILNAAGVKNVYAYGNYKFKIYDANDVLIRTLDNQYYMVPATTSEVVNSIAYANSPYSASALNQLIKVNTTAGAVTIYLPTAVGNEGIEIIVLKTSSDANAVTVDSDTLFSQDINGANSASLGTDQYSFMGFISDNANWFVSQNVNTATVTATSTTTMTNKTLTTPVIASFYQDAGKTKLMTTPNTASDTLVAIAATQTLTNKTLTLPTITTASYTGLVAAGGSFGTDWAEVSSYEVYLLKDPMGFVHLRGVVASSGTVTTAMTIPAGYRPVTGYTLQVTYIDGGVTKNNVAGIADTGVVSIGGGVTPAPGDMVVLDNITYKAA